MGLWPFLFSSVFVDRQVCFRRNIASLVLRPKVGSIQIGSDEIWRNRPNRNVPFLKMANLLTAIGKGAHCQWQIASCHPLRRWRLGSKRLTPAVARLLAISGKGMEPSEASTIGPWGDRSQHIWIGLSITYPCHAPAPRGINGLDHGLGCGWKAMKSTSIRGLNQTRGICSWKETLRDINSMHMYIYIYCESTVDNRSVVIQRCP